MNKGLQCLALAVVLTGCTVGPDYHRPNVTTPAGWTRTPVGGPADRKADLGGWWQKFNDPQLNDLIERALQSSPDLRLAQARVRESRARYGVASAKLWPTVDTSAGYARVGTSHHQPVLGSMPIPPNVPFENDFYRAGFDAAWELDFAGGTRRGREAARAEVMADEAAQRSALVTLLAEIAANYLDLRAQQSRLAIVRSNIVAQETALGLTVTRYTNGLVSNLDVEQATALLSSTRADSFTLETGIQASIYRLDVLLGQPPGALAGELSLAKPLPAAQWPVPAGLPSELLRRRPDVQRAERQLAAATARMGAARADLFPKFYLTGAAGFESVSATDWFTAGSKFWSAGPTVQWRIFDAGRIRSNIKVQDAKQEQALVLYEQTALRAFEEVENALASYAHERQRRAALADGAGASQRSLDIAQKLYAAGLTSFLNVLDAERSLYHAQDLLARSDQALSTDLVALYKALGGGWETFSLNSTTRL